MLILLEGCDGAGKSTLADRLILSAERIGMPHKLLHRGVPERDPFLEYTEDLVDYQPHAKPVELWVLDRWHLGELVYGPIYRGKSLLGGRGRKMIEQLLLEKGASRVLMDAPNDLLEHRAFESRGEEYLKRADLPRVADAYRKLVENRPAWTTLPSPTNEAETRDAVEYMLRRAARIEYAAYRRIVKAVETQDIQEA